MLKLYNYLDEVILTQKITQQAHPPLQYSLSELMELLEIEQPNELLEPLKRAINVCVSLHISVEDNFKKVYKYVDGEMKPDWELSPLAGYLLMINCDPSNPIIAKAQLLFILQKKI
ncbi:hypothetical protein [Solitalea canadensis]|uniref:Uncharacterized protein n=1 Tax=Solitalea canadensis (strain ATCC 29591 / DSM 3403 / JCM 21819 / LMG 8368 / NBRC 15130 / NCIMB 12057 / USAM 9D) TaxID=929556 RepID=H8KRE2_SOLCM|nr:hypothetical protein [Solitalea canadensis]AFD07467.1 hypothetical protein Solca_2426 [Solitalea canadensis DSM 3403]